MVNVETYKNFVQKWIFLELFQDWIRSILKGVVDDSDSFSDDSDLSSPAESSIFFCLRDFMRRFWNHTFT